MIVIGFALAVGLLLWGLRYVQASDPYIHEVLSLTGDDARGKEIFKLNCATCHGLYADGEVGPDLHHVSERKTKVGLIQQVISGNTPPMPQFQPNSKDMADLLSFLETL
ncbi:MAG: cytochrome c [Cyanobacteria bacterium P01_G01_bin.38]